MYRALLQRWRHLRLATALWWGFTAATRSPSMTSPSARPPARASSASIRPWSASSPNGYIQQLEEEHLQILSRCHHHGQDRSNIPGPGTYKRLRDLVQAWLQTLGTLAPKPPLPQNIAKCILKSLDVNYSSNYTHDC
jgi:hypothetical protein